VANTPSARKRVRITERRTAINKMRKSKIRTAIRKVRLAVAHNDKENLGSLLSAASSALDKGVHTGILHKNNASRKKGRLMKLVTNKIAAI
jgi:small subunit ribosomal protein S20